MPNSFHTIENLVSFQLQSDMYFCFPRDYDRNLPDYEYGERDSEEPQEKEKTPKNTKDLEPRSPPVQKDPFDDSPEKEDPKDRDSRRERREAKRNDRSARRDNERYCCTGEGNNLVMFHAGVKGRPFM